MSHRAIVAQHADDFLISSIRCLASALLMMENVQWDDPMVEEAMIKAFVKVMKHRDKILSSDEIDKETLSRRLREISSWNDFENEVLGDILREFMDLQDFCDIISTGNGWIEVLKLAPQWALYDFVAAASSLEVRRENAARACRYDGARQ